MSLEPQKKSHSCQQNNVQHLLHYVKIFLMQIWKDLSIQNHSSLMQFWWDNSHKLSVILTMTLFIHPSTHVCLIGTSYFFFVIIFLWNEIICRNYSSIILCNVERKMNFNNEMKVKFQSMSSSAIIIVSPCSRRWECRKNLNWLYRRRMSLHTRMCSETYRKKWKHWMRYKMKVTKGHVCGLTLNLNKTFFYY